MTSMSVLRIPQPQAEEQLAKRIEGGRELMGLIFSIVHREVDPPDSWPFTSFEERDDLVNRAARWHAFNRTWIEVNLGGQASEEYRRDLTFDWITDPTRWGQVKLLEHMSEAIQKETSKLESIHDRLSI